MMRSRGDEPTNDPNMFDNCHFNIRFARIWGFLDTLSNRFKHKAAEAYLNDPKHG